MSYLDDPRVFFAAERTLLAWQRTSIALMGLGILTGVKGSGDAALGVLFLLAGAGALLHANRQYGRFLRELSAPEIPRGHLTWAGPFLNTVLAVAALFMALRFVLG